MHKSCAHNFIIGEKTISHPRLDANPTFYLLTIKNLNIHLVIKFFYYCQRQKHHLEIYLNSYLELF